MKESRRTRTLHLGEEKKHFQMLNVCYAPWGDEDEWKRRYLEFPGFDISRNVLIIEEKGEWAGGVTVWFREAVLSNGKKIKVSLPGDGYVLPAFEGKGVFSTSMHAANEMSQTEGALLSFTFPAVYGHSALALSKYGFMNVLYPVAKVYILKPERFLDDFLSRTRRVVLNERFDDLNVKLMVPLDRNKKEWVERVFHIEKGEFKEVETSIGNRTNIDLTVKADVGLIISAASLFYRRKRRLYIILLGSLLRRRLGLRFSLKFLRVLMGF